MAPGDRVAGLNRFKLIVRENLTEPQPLVIRMAREAHVLVQDHRLVRVRINNRREKLFYFTNLLDDEYAEAAGQASLRTVTYDYDDGWTDKALVFTDSVPYRDTTFDFPEHFRRALTQMGVPREDWDPLLRRYSAFQHRNQRPRRRRPGGLLRPRVPGTIRGHTLCPGTEFTRVHPGQPPCIPEHGERQVLSRARS